MKFIRQFVLSLIFLLFIRIHVWADLSDTIIAIDRVETKAIRFNSYSVGTKIITFDSLTLKNCQAISLADLFQQQGPVSVKMYGPGGMASISIRGGSSRHTAVIWNGFNIKNPMAGSINYSALPAGFIDNIAIQPGGSCTMYGSGAASGIIFLSNNVPVDDKGITGMVHAEGGSFNTANGLLTLGYSKKFFATRIRAGIQTSENDFRFKNKEKFSRPVDTLHHAQYKRYAIAHQMAFRIGQSSLLETNIWYVGMYKEIPALISDYEESKANETDNNFRIALNYSVYGTRWFLKYRCGYIADRIHYCDSVSAVDNDNYSLSWINEAESKYKISKNQELFAGVNHTFEKAQSEGYVSDTSRSRFSVFGRYNLFLLQEKINLSAEVRKELVDNATLPFVYSLGTDIKILNDLRFKATFSKHYALPVLDDLYWAEDSYSKGNPKLKPEYGWNGESGFVYSKTLENIIISNELTFFYNRIYDLIIWLPGGEGKWEPDNVNESVSEGIEFSGNINSVFGKSVLAILYCYSYTHTVIFKEGSEISEGSPRIYVPEHMASLTLGYKLDNWYLRYTQTYTGIRYYDDTHSLPEYTVADIKAGREIHLKNIQLNGYVCVKNLFNTQYQVMKGYAQAPIHFLVGLNISF